MHLALTREFDVIVLDVMLPGMDGLAFCRKLRGEAKRDTPVLMLTARDTVVDKLEGFRAGTDDYLVKPFSLEELEARLLALFRRFRPNRGELFRVGDLELDLGTRSVRRAGRTLDLNPASFTILTDLMRASPNAVPVVRPRREERRLWTGFIYRAVAVRPVRLEAPDRQRGWRRHAGYAPELSST